MRIFIFITLLLLSSTSFAQITHSAKRPNQIQIGVGYQSYLESSGKLDNPDYNAYSSGVSIDNFYVGAAYKIAVGNGFYVLPEASMAIITGSGTGTISANGRSVDVDVELDRVLMFGVRFQYETVNKVSLFVAPTRVMISANGTVSAPNGTTEHVKVTGSKFGLGVGLGYQFAANTGAEFSYTHVNNSNSPDVGILKLGVNFMF